MINHHVVNAVECLSKGQQWNLNLFLDVYDDTFISIHNIVTNII